MKFIKNVRNGHRGSWLTVSLEEYFDYSDIIKNIKTSPFAIVKFINNERSRLVIVFPEPDWDVPPGWGITTPQIVEKKNIEKFLKKQISWGCTNYYIFPTKIPPRWAIVLCHEGDVHILESK